MKKQQKVINLEENDFEDISAIEYHTNIKHFGQERAYELENTDIEVEQSAQEFLGMTDEEYEKYLELDIDPDIDAEIDRIMRED